MQEALKTTIAGNLDGQAGMDDNQKVRVTIMGRWAGEDARKGQDPGDRGCS